MNEFLVFRIPTVSEDKEKLICDLNLNFKKILSNDRTTIYENSDMRLCFDSKVIRIVLFNNNIVLLERLREYFYGEEYKRI